MCDEPGLELKVADDQRTLGQADAIQRRSSEPGLVVECVETAGEPGWSLGSSSPATRGNDPWPRSRRTAVEPWRTRYAAPVAPGRSV
jgi:hypothetical protein